MDEQHTPITLDQLSRKLSISRRWLSTEAKAGRIPSLVAGRRRLFNVAAVRAALADRAARSTPDWSGQ